MGTASMRCIFLNSLFEPSPKIPARYKRNAALLSGMIIALTLLLVMSLVVEPMPVPGGRIMLVAGAAALSVLYFLSRTKFYLLTAIGFVAVFIVMSGFLCMRSLETGKDSSVVPILWFFLPILISSIFLPPALTTVLAVSVPSGLYAVFVFTDHAIDPTVVSGFIMLMVFSSALVFSVFHRKAVTEEDLSALMGSMAKAKTEIEERMRIQSKLEARAELDGFIRGIDILILEAKPLVEILGYIREHTLKMFGCLYFSIVLFDDELRTVTILGQDAFSSWKGAEAFFSDKAVPLENLDPSGIAIRRIAEGRPSFVMDAAEVTLPEPLAGKVRKAGIGSFLFVLIRVESKLIGMQVLSFAGRGEISGEVHSASIETAHQIGIAIQNERMRSRLERHARALEESLAQKEALLKEVHHRVKNNLQVISSLLSLEAAKSVSSGDAAVFTDLQNRVRAIAGVHENLYQSEDLACIGFREYMETLVAGLMTSFTMPQDKVRIDIGAGDLDLPADLAVPIGLIVTELVSNSFKHAFPGERKGVVRINFVGTGTDRPMLIVSDDGQGLPGDFFCERDKGMGLGIVEVLARQVEARMSIEGRNGTTVTFEFDRGISVPRERLLNRGL